MRDVPHGPVEQVVVSLRSARARERLDRERSDLVATVAHELRSPLTGVKGFVATLLSKWDKLNDDQKKLMLETVNADADRLTRLIAELLDVARIDTGRLSLYPRPIDFAPAVERALASVRAGTGREIAFEVEGELPQIMADPDKLVQVVHQPRRERRPARRGHWSGSPRPRSTATRRSPACGCTSTTRARGSARRSAPGSSPSSGSTAPAAAPVWACTSSTAWSPRTAGRRDRRRARRRSPDHHPLAGVTPVLRPHGGNRFAAPRDATS